PTGTVHLDNSTLELDRESFHFNRDGGTIRGSWQIENGTLFVPLLFSATDVDDNAVITLDGPRSIMQGLWYLTNNRGTMNLRNAAFLRIAPGLPNFYNQRLLSIAATSSLTIDGGFAQSVDGNTDVYFNGLSNPVAPSIVARDRAILAGTLNIAFSDGF